MEHWKSRTELLIGEAGLERLASSHVLVIGLGGVGGISAEMTARAGVGRMTLVDGDTVEETNLNRQTAALTTTLGRLKTEVMAERIRAVNPSIIIKTIGEFLDENRMTEVLSEEKYDCVLDAIDSVGPKTRLIEYCVRNGVKLVSSMGSGARMNPELVRAADISKTEGCALARTMRKRLRELGITKGVRTVFSPEPPVKGALTRTAVGTLSYMPNVFGCHCACNVIKMLLE